MAAQSYFPKGQIKYLPTGQSEPAKRGDLVIVRTQEMVMGTMVTLWSVAIVTSITRDGQIKRYQPAESPHESRREWDRRAFQESRTHYHYRVISKSAVDVDKVMQAASENKRDGRTTPFGEASEVDALISAHRK